MSATEPEEKLDVTRREALPGIELWGWRVAGRGEFAMLTGTFMFGGPDRPRGGPPSGKLWYRGRHHDVDGGFRLCLEPGEVYQGSFHDVPAQGMNAHVLHLDPAFAHAYVDPERAGARLRLVRMLTAEPATLARFERACAAIESGEVDPMEREHLVRRFLDEAFVHADDEPARAPPPACDRRVRRASEMVRDRFADPLTLTELAGEVGLSVFHLERSFRERLGVPVHRYLQLVRVERSMAMLRRGVRIADVALACGFADQAHMTRTYRRLLHFTPGQMAGR
jgi:AraC-like DNA-binding protein